VLVALAYSFDPSARRRVPILPRRTIRDHSGGGGSVLTESAVILKVLEFYAQ
jgi:hypothetical protein